MKLLKQTLIGAVLTLFTGVAFGQTTNIHLTGSTAYRANTYRAIQASLTAGYSFAYSGTAATQASLEGSTYAIFVGTLASNGHPVRIKTHWTGSEGGIQVVGNPLKLQPYYPDTQAVSTGTGTNSSGTPVNMESSDIDMADTFQAASNFLGRYKGFTYPALSENSNSPVGVVPFKFYGAPGTTLTNVTSQQAKALYSANNGTLPLSFFTGNTADATTTVVATGRDPDSGTRATLFAETGIGTRTVAAGNQAPFNANTNSDTSVGDVVSTEAGAIDHFNTYPAGSVNGINYIAGDNGFNSGGTLATTLNNTTPANTQYIGYASTNDGDKHMATAFGHLGTGTKELSFNGVMLGGGTTTTYDYNTNTNLTQGPYTYWGYEHMYMGAGATGDILQAANDISANLKSTNAQIFLTSMHCSRTSDGSTVLP